MKNTIFYLALLIGMFFSGLTNANTNGDSIKSKKCVKVIYASDDNNFKFDSCFSSKVSDEEIEAIIEKVTKEHGIDDAHTVIKKQNAMVWIDSDDEEKFDITVETLDDDSVKVFVMKGQNGMKKVIKTGKPAYFSSGKGHTWHSFDDENIDMDVHIEKIDGDSVKVMVITSDDGKIKKEMILNDLHGKKGVKILKFDDKNGMHGHDFKLPETQFFRHAPRNLIDLNDPDIISFEREEIKGGKEKITIIRKKAKEED